MQLKILSLGFYLLLALAACTEKQDIQSGALAITRALVEPQAVSKASAWWEPERYAEPSAFIKDMQQVNVYTYLKARRRQGADMRYKVAAVTQESKTAFRAEVFIDIVSHDQTAKSDRYRVSLGFKAEEPDIWKLNSLSIDKE
ncbi:MAG: hypothetical protein BMS9Abin36_0037 [Gammaproteobacteria bacterium]|nr:MAG: hypothetical protein BMS9Abin36_0037 [Gammaproteobacteria bacterium]